MHKKGFKFQFLVIVLVISFLVVSLSFQVVYLIFRRQLEEQVQGITIKVFEQTEKTIDASIRQINKTMYQILELRSSKEFLTNSSPSELERIYTDLAITTEIGGYLRYAPEIHSVTLIGADSRAIGASANRTYTGTVDSGALSEMEAESTVLCWFPALPAAFLQNNRELGEALYGPNLLYGLRRLPTGAYVLLTLYESTLARAYGQLLYHESLAMIVDDGTIISCNENALVGSELAPRLQADFSQKMGSIRAADEQVIYYRADLEDWLLLNIIPKSTYERSINSIKILVVALYAATLTAFFGFMIFVVSNRTKPVERIIAGMQRVSEGDLNTSITVSSGIDELDQANAQFNRMVENLRELIRKTERIEEEKKQEEIRTLQYQINPHFLYNSITSIRWMAMAAGAPNVADALVALVKLVQPVFKTPSFFWTTRQELAFSENYIYMLTLRFGAKLAYHIHCDEGLEEYPFPKFILQPVIENCFVHAMDKAERLEIVIRIAREGSFVTALVEDNAGGVPPDTVQRLNDSLRRVEPSENGESIGLKNVNRRLFLLYQTAGAIRLSSDRTTRVTIRLPYSEPAPPPAGPKENSDEKIQTS